MIDRQILLTVLQQAHVLDEEPKPLSGRPPKLWEGTTWHTRENIPVNAFLKALLEFQ